MATVRELMAQIDAENASAKQGLEGLAQVAKHAFITRRAETVASLVDELVKEVGYEEAMMLLSGEKYAPLDETSPTKEPHH